MFAAQKIRLYADSQVSGWKKSGYADSRYVVALLRPLLTTVLAIRFGATRSRQIKNKNDTGNLYLNNFLKKILVQVMKL